MLSILTRSLLLAVVLLTLPQPVLAAKPGNSNLIIRQRSTGASSVEVQVGSSIQVEVFIEGEGDQITGSQVFLTFNDDALELVPAGFDNQSGLPIPFTSGGYIRGVPFQNNTINDQIGNSDANGIPNFQLRYFENISATPFGNPNPATGNGALCFFTLRVTRKVAGNSFNIGVDRVSPVGDETGYFKTGDPGSTYGFRSIQTMLIRVKGFDATLALPDLHLLPGEVDNSLDLDDYIDDPITPDANLIWTKGTPVPNNINVTIDPVSHIVTVDPRDFIGISSVPFVVDDNLGGFLRDTILVTVDTPPAFDDAAVLDLVQFDEDMIDTSLLLVATDPDEGAVLTFAPDSMSALNPNLSITIDQLTGRTTLTPTKDYFGADTLLFTVKDQFGLGDLIEVNIVVKPINDPPEWLVKPLPNQSVGLLGRSEMDLASRVRGVDDAFEDLNFTFGGADSIAFDVINNNTTMTITPVRPFMGVETVTVVVTDTSEAADVTTLRVEVLPPADPQPPEVGPEFLKIDVVAGGVATNTQLDPHVSDLDHADSDLIWTTSPVNLISIDAQNLVSRIHVTSASSESVGYEPSTLTVTDPTNLRDTLAVRIYSSSLDTGIPQAGGLPDVLLAAGAAREILLDNYYFDANNTDAEMTWTAAGQQTVIIAIDALTHVATITAPSVITNQIENVTFSVTDLANQSSSDDIRITLVPEGGVVVDFSTIGGRRDIGVGVPDTLGLDQFILVGTPGNIVWSAKSQTAQTILAQILDKRSLQLIGLVEGDADVMITATDTSSVNSSTGTIRVFANHSTNPGELQVQDYGALTLMANRDTTIDLSALVTSGNSAAVSWASVGNNNVGVKIDDVNKIAILRPVLGFVGDAGPIVFTANDLNSEVTVFSTAAPVTVEGSAGTTRGLLEVSLIVNPIRKNFIDAFIVSRRELLSSPIVELQVGVGAGASPRVLRIEPVEVTRIWVGDFIIDDLTIGTVQVSATGITSETRIALTDTAVIEVGEAGISKDFKIRNGSAAVTLPMGSVDRRTKVALFENRSIDQASGQGLQPVSGQYVVHSASAEVTVPGRISLNVEGNPDERMGIYRKAFDGRWIYVPTRVESGLLVADFGAFGTYGAFLDEFGATRIRALTLHPNFPNPFNPQTQIQFDIAEQGTYELLIFNVLGQQVRALARDTFAPGLYRLSWDARDDYGLHVGAGVYLYRLVSRHEAVTRKMMLLK